MKLAFWRRNRKPPVTIGAASVTYPDGSVDLVAPDVEPPEPREINCKFCGTVTVTDPEEHLNSPEHRLNQANAIVPTALPAELDPGEW